MVDDTSAQPGRSRARKRNYLGSIRKDLGDLQGFRAMVSELIQNSDDAEGATEMRISVDEHALTIWNDASFSRCDDLFVDPCPWVVQGESPCDFHSFSDVAGEGKIDRDDATGAFGIGFTSVYQVTDQPVLTSAGQQWTIIETNPEAERFYCVDVVDTGGTEFLLPWARSQSEMRKALGQPAVADADIDELTSIIFESVPAAMLFLRRLKRVTVVTSSRSTAFERDRTGPIISVASSDGDSRRWYAIDGDIDDQARELLDRYPEELDAQRDTAFSVAVSLDSDEPGRFFATLPTEERTGLSVSVQGSFFPKPDRKRIRLDSAPASEWNRAIIEAAADLLASTLESLRDSIGDDGMVGLLAAALAVSHQAEGGTLDRSAASWWRHLKPSLGTAAVVPTICDGHVLAQSALLWGGHDAERDCAELLSTLGHPLVEESVRARWFEFVKPLGMRQLNLGHVVTAISTSTVDASEWISELSPDHRTALWDLLEHQLDTPNRSSQESVAVLRRLPLLPSRSGGFSGGNELRRSQTGALRLLDAAGIEAPILEAKLLGRRQKLVELVAETSPADMVTWIDDAERRALIPGTFDRGELLDWFAARRDTVLPQPPKGFRELAIFPTGSGFQPLGALPLPTDGFRDPLDLGDVLHLEGRPETTRVFLADLGVPRLTLDHYCTDFVPQAVENGLSEAKIEGLLDFLGTNLSHVRESEEVGDSLRPLNLVPCTDGSRREGKSVYFEGVDRLLVGPDHPVAKRPASENRRLLYRWLGVEDQPRSQDVVAQCASLRTWSQAAVEIATAVLRHLAQFEPTVLETYFLSLQDLAWIPVKGEERTERPDVLYAVFSENLFASQADFVGLPQPVQNSCTEAMAWLGIRTNPAADLVVRHLLHCRDNGTKVKDDMWAFLNRNADDDALGALHDEQCILLSSGEYVAGHRCFWSDHPFDSRFRFQLSEHFRQWQALFDRLGVREAPDLTDALDVLEAIAIAHGGAEDPALSADVEVVQRTWVFMNELLRADTIDDHQLDDLRTIECVLDASRVLRTPVEVLFKDSSAIAEAFDDEANARLIKRPENTARALEAAGVRHLRGALTTDIVERTDAEGTSRLEALLSERRLLILRVLSSIDDSAAFKLDRFERNTAVTSLAELRVVEKIEIGGQSYESEPIDRIAVHRPQEREILVVEGEPGARRWDEIAIELAHGLGIAHEHIPNVAMSLKSVFEEPTFEDVVRVLDIMGFAPLDESLDTTHDTLVSDGYEHDEQRVEAPEFPPDGDAVPTPELPTPGDAWGDPPSLLEEPPTGTQRPGSGGTSGTQDLERDPGGGGRKGEWLEEDEEGGGPVGSHASPSERREREQLRSYVRPKGQTEDSDGGDELADERVRFIDEAAMTAVMEYEARVGRSPERMPHENEGFDVRSTAADGTVRYIEVKGTSPRWDKQGVALSSRQFDEAQTRTSEFWLYVVEVESSGADPIRIQDPANRVKQFFFDVGWGVAREPDEDKRLPLPDLPLELDQNAESIPIVDWNDGEAVVGYLTMADLDHGPGAFGMQIVGHSLGFGLRGGVVIAELETEPEDTDWVVVRLRNKFDPDTRSPVSVRQWAPETDMNGEFQGLRLVSDGSVAPILIESMDEIEVLGVVDRRIPITDLPGRASKKD